MKHSEAVLVSNDFIELSNSIQTLSEYFKEFSVIQNPLHITDMGEFSDEAADKVIQFDC